MKAEFFNYEWSVRVLDEDCVIRCPFSKRPMQIAKSGQLLLEREEEGYPVAVAFWQHEFDERCKLIS